MRDIFFPKTMTIRVPNLMTKLIAAEVANTLNSLSTIENKTVQAQILSDKIQNSLEQHTENLQISDAMLDLVSEIVVSEFSNQIANGSTSTEDIMSYLGIGAITQ